MRTIAVVETPKAEQYVFSEDHPLRPERFLWALDLARAVGVLQEADRVEGRPADPAFVTEIHDPRYVEGVRMLSEGFRLAEMLDYGFGLSDNPPFPGMFEASLAVVGGSVTAAEAVINGAPVAINLAGGLHHAKRAQASGFCIFNDPAIAIHVLKRRFRRIMYLDIDAHHGDGVQWIYYEDPTVLTVSLHESGRYLYPGTGHPNEIGAGPGAGYCVNLPMEQYTGDDVWWWAFEQVVPRLFEWFRPEVLVLQMGCDAHFADPLTHLQLTVQGWLRVIQWVRSCEIPVVALGGGGYALDAAARMWTLALAVFKDIPLPQRLPEDHFLYQKSRSFFDLYPPEIPSGWRQVTRHFAEQVVEELRKQLTPYGVWK